MFFLLSDDLEDVPLCVRHYRRIDDILQSLRSSG